MAMLPAQAPPERDPVREIRARRAGGPGRGLAGRSDERLVEIAREGDERAFEVIYERHSAAILRYCRSLLRSAQEAEDVKQEVFVLAISALRRGADPDAFRPWLYRVAHNACISHLRVRRPVLVADNGVLIGPATAAEPVGAHREELRQLLDDLGTLPDVQRGALLLREMDGFSYEQVGEVLGLPASTVRASIFRARRTLQGLAEARDADCQAIQTELSELADRRGRRARHITSHLHVCSSCRDFRDGLRRRPAVLGAVDPVTAPAALAGALLALKGKLLGGAAGGGAGTAIAGGGGAAGVAKISAVVASSVALLAGAGLEAERVIERSHESGAAAVTRSAPPRAAAASARGAGGGATGAASALSAAPAASDPGAAADAHDATPDTPGDGTRARARAREEQAHGSARSTPSAAATTSSPSATASPEAHSTADAEDSGSGHRENGAGDDASSDRGHRRGSGRDDDGDRADRSGSGSRDRARDADRSAPARPPTTSGSSGSGKREDGVVRTPSGSPVSGSSGGSSSHPLPAPDDEPETPDAPDSSGSGGPAPASPTDPAPDPSVAAAPAEPVPPLDPNDGEPAGPGTPSDPPAGDEDAGATAADTAAATADEPSAPPPLP